LHRKINYKIISYKTNNKKEVWNFFFFWIHINKTKFFWISTKKYKNKKKKNCTNVNYKNNWSYIIYWYKKKNKNYTEGINKKKENRRNRISRFYKKKKTDYSIRYKKSLKYYKKTYRGRERTDRGDNLTCIHYLKIKSFIFYFKIKTIYNYKNKKNRTIKVVKRTFKHILIYHVYSPRIKNY